MTKAIHFEELDELVGLKVMDLVDNRETTIVATAWGQHGQPRVKVAFNKDVDARTGNGTWRGFDQISLI